MWHTVFRFSLFFSAPSGTRCNNDIRHPVAKYDIVQNNKLTDSSYYINVQRRYASLQNCLTFETENNNKQASKSICLSIMILILLFSKVDMIVYYYQFKLLNVLVPHWSGRFSLLVISNQLPVLQGNLCHFRLRLRATTMRQRIHGNTRK